MDQNERLAEVTGAQTGLIRTDTEIHDDSQTSVPDHQN